MEEMEENGPQGHTSRRASPVNRARLRASVTALLSVVLVAALAIAYFAGLIPGVGRALGASAPNPAPKAYIGLFKDNAVAVVDTGTNRLLGTIPVPTGPHGLVVTPDGKRVYVSSDGASTISVVDTGTDRVTGSIEVGKSPHGLAITPDGSRILAAIFGTSEVVSIDTSTNQVVGRAPVGSPHNVAISPDGRFAYVASQRPGASGLAVLDVAKMTQLGWVPLDKTPRAIAYSPDGKMLYFTLGGSDAVQVLDPATHRVVGQIAVGASPHQPLFTTVGTPSALVIVQGPGALAIVDPSKGTVAGDVKVGQFPHWAAVTPDGKAAYVTNENSGDVSVVDLATRKVSATIPVGNGPRKIVIQPSAGGMAGMAMGGGGTTSAPTPGQTSSAPQAASAIPAGQPSGPSAATVKIASFAFSQPAVTVARGQTITWTNDDSVPHSVTSDDGIWDSGAIQPGGTFSHTFDQPGTYAYHCSFHPFMKATVTITA